MYSYLSQQIRVHANKLIVKLKMKSVMKSCYNRVIQASQDHQGLRGREVLRELKVLVDSSAQQALLELMGRMEYQVNLEKEDLL